MRVSIGEALARAGIEPREARHLLAQAAGVPESRIVAYPDAPLDESVRARFEAWAARRRRGEPVAYLTGRREFYGLSLRVTPAVLIPRHESELLVERAAAVLPPGARARVLDLGTGSGALALAIKRARPAAEVIAVDASDAALAVARGNACALGLEVRWRLGSWFTAVAGERFELVVSNPPYVARGDPRLDQGDLRFEPRAALDGGVDGLDAIRCIVAGAAAHLGPGGWLLLEHGYDQAAAVCRLLADAGLERAGTWRDLSGHERVSGACRAAGRARIDRIGAPR